MFLSHTHIQTELQMYPLSWVHSPLLAHPFCGCSSLGQTCVSPHTSLIPMPVRTHTMSSCSHTLSVGVCVLHTILVRQHLGTSTSHQLTGYNVSGEQQVLLLLLQGLFPVLKNINASFIFLFKLNCLFQMSLCDSLATA